MVEEKYLPSRVMVAVLSSLATFVVIAVVTAIYGFVDGVKEYDMGVEDTCAQFNYTFEACPVNNKR